MPSILIEMGFLTNPKEEDFLNSKQGKEYMASAIYRAIKKYIASVEEVPLEKLAKVGEEESIQEIVEKPEFETIKEEKDTLDINYRVQLLVSNDEIDLDPSNFNGLDPVSKLQANGFYKYYYGKASTYESAKELRDQANQKGFTESFVVSFNGEIKIDLQEALTLESKN
jgi:N-acetylmuramoyl-L-alanine amidase